MNPIQEHAWQEKEAKISELLLNSLLRGYQGQQRDNLLSQILRSLAEPQFQRVHEYHGANPHEWRKYVRSPICDVWNDLPLVAQLVAYTLAETQASNEYWD